MRLNQLKEEMNLFDTFHPKVREAIRDNILNFNLLSLSGSAKYWAKKQPGRFIPWLRAQTQQYSD